MTDRLRSIETAHDDLAAILAPTNVAGRELPLAIHARNRCADARRGFPGASAYDNPRVHTSSDGSPPPPGVDLDGRADDAAADLAKWDKALRMAEQGAAALLFLTRKWQPRHPDTVAQRKAAADNARTQPLLCDLCATVGHSAVARSATTCPCYRTDGTIAWQLDGPRTLCEWCQGRTKLLHRLPNPKELRQHRLAHPVGVPVMERKRAEARMLVAGEGAGMADVRTWSSGDVA